MGKVQYYYGGISLKEWCINNGYSPSTAYNFITHHKTDYPDNESLVNAAVEHLKTMDSFYYYEGKLFKTWCLENDYSYTTGMSIINRLKPNYLDKQELVEKAVSELKILPPKTTYFYKNQSLRKYCQENNLSYTAILSRIAKIKNKTRKLSNDEIVKAAIEDYTDSRCKYYYSGMSLKKYCEKTGYSYQAIVTKIINLDEQAAQKVISNYFKSKPKKIRPSYKIEGISLRKYCEKYNYTYPTVKTYIQNIKKTNPELTDNEVAIKAIKYYEENHISKEKYFYQGERLVDYLGRKKCSYKTFLGYLNNYQVEDPANLSTEIVEQCLSKCRAKEVRDLFKKLQTTSNEKEIFAIATELSISKESLNLLIEADFTPRQALNFVWYFGTEKDKKISITKERIEVITNTKANSDMELSELFGYYKSGIEDTRNILIEKCYRPCKSILNKLIKRYYLVKDKDFCEELNSQMILSIYDFIERSNSNNMGHIVNYMNRMIKGELTRKILAYFIKKKQLSLNKEIYSYSETTYQDKLKYKESVNSEFISEELLEKILTLEEVAQQIIVLRYQKEYTYEDISIRLGLTVSEIKELETEALLSLKSILTNSYVKIKS